MRLFSDSYIRVSDPYLRRALELAERARGATAPNPLVGCVIVADGRVVGEGYHPRAGEAHAEVFALAAAGSDARCAVAYVTLEPCNHHGKTPPCTDALIAAGVSRVVIGMPDPTPQAGGGAERLRAAGIDVEFAEDPSAFEELNEAWLARVRTGLPLVTVKVGASLDARLAFVRGERAAITGPSGAEVTRRLRAGCDAIVVGAATVDADDPSLTVRDASGSLAEHQPLRVVLARSSVPSPDSRVFCDDAAPTLVLAADTLPADNLSALPSHVIVQHYDSAAGLTEAWRELARRGCSEVLVEAGPGLLSALWTEHAFDHLAIVTAGGMAGPDAVPLFLGAADREEDTLVAPLAPLEAGIVGDVSVTVWRAQHAIER